MRYLIDQTREGFESRNCSACWLLNVFSENRLSARVDINGHGSDGTSFLPAPLPLLRAHA